MRQQVTRNDSDEAERSERSLPGVVSAANVEGLAGAARQVNRHSCGHSASATEPGESARSGCRLYRKPEVTIRSRLFLCNGLHLVSGPFHAPATYHNGYWQFRLIPYLGLNDSIPKNYEDSGRRRNSGVFACPAALTTNYTNFCSYSLNPFTDIAYSSSLLQAVPRAAASPEGTTTWHYHVRPETRFHGKNDVGTVTPSNILFIAEQGYSGSGGNVIAPHFSTADSMSGSISVPAT